MESSISFDKTEHLYTRGDKKLISVTQLLKKMGLSPDYGNVNQEVLERKAERGTLIHSEIEHYNKEGEPGFTEECGQYAFYIEKNDVKCLHSEEMVGDDEIAGTIDLVLDVDGAERVADIKTTAQLHTDSVSWQLSLYAYLYNKQETDKVATDFGYAYHFGNDSILEVVKVAMKPEKEVENLLQCYREGKAYEPSLPDSITYAVAEISEAERIISKSKSDVKEAEERKKKVTQSVIEAMKKNGLNSFETETIKLTITPEFDRKSVDSAKLKEEYPDVFEKCSKTSHVSEGLRVTDKTAKRKAK